MDTSFAIGQTGLNDVDSIKRHLISAVDRIESTHPTVTPNFAYKLKCSSRRKTILGFSSKSICLDITI